MFKNIRVGSPLYLLHKNEPKLEIGEVESVTQQPPQFTMSYQSGVPYQQQKENVDIQLCVNGEKVTLQQIPSNMEIADIGNGMVVSENKDTMMREVEALRRNSRSVLDSIDKHQSIVEKCNDFLAILNPDVKKEAERIKEMDALRENVNALGDDVSEIKEMLTRILKSKKE